MSVDLHVSKQRKFETVIRWDGMFINVELLWTHSDYHTASVWCLSTHKKFDNVS
jgi:hypothetical protein